MPDNVYRDRRTSLLVENRSLRKCMIRLTTNARPEVTREIHEVAEKMKEKVVPTATPNNHHRRRMSMDDVTVVKTEKKESSSAYT